jgi:heptose I phosphotransferase
METIWIADHRLEQLRAAGLATFEQVMANTAGQCKRVLSDRENWYLPGGDSVRGTQYSVLSTRIESSERRVVSSAATTHQCATISGGSRGTRPHSTCFPIGDQSPGFYLKKHHGRTWRTWLATFMGVAPPRSPGRVEAENALALNALGIDVMPLTAYGEKLHADGRWDSFLLSEELEGYCELQDFIEWRFAKNESTQDLHRLILQVANIARRFHAAGFNHRDFYCCHFLVKEVSPGTFDVRLIDLQRVQRRKWFRHRWIVKDLAQLASMSPEAHVGCREKVLFLRAYLGVKKLRPQDKRLVGAVLRKLASIRRHTSRTNKQLGRHVSPMRKRVGESQ